MVDSVPASTDGKPSPDPASEVRSSPSPPSAMSWCSSLFSIFLKRIVSLAVVGGGVVVVVVVVGRGVVVVVVVVVVVDFGVTLHLVILARPCKSEGDISCQTYG